MNDDRSYSAKFPPHYVYDPATETMDFSVLIPSVHSIIPHEVDPLANAERLDQDLKAKLAPVDLKYEGRNHVDSEVFRRLPPCLDELLVEDRVVVHAAILARARGAGLQDSLRPRPAPEYLQGGTPS